MSLLMNILLIVGAAVLGVALFAIRDINNKKKILTQIENARKALKRNTININNSRQFLQKESTYPNEGNEKSA